jgi:hypothetical protein
MNTNQAIKIAKKVINDLSDEKEKDALTHLIRLARQRQAFEKSQISVSWGKRTSS